MCGLGLEGAQHRKKKERKKKGWKMLKLRATASRPLTGECQALVHLMVLSQALGHLMVLTAGYDRCSLSLLRGRRTDVSGSCSSKVPGGPGLRTACLYTLVSGTTLLTRRWASG